MIGRRDNFRPCPPPPDIASPDLADEEGPTLADCAAKFPRDVIPATILPPLQFDISPGITITIAGDRADAFHVIRDWLNGPAQADLIAALLERARDR